MCIRDRCGSKAEEENIYDQEMMEQYADAIIMNFSNMDDEAMDTFRDMSDLELNLMLMQSGLPVEGDDFLAMLDAWSAGMKECGSFVAVSYTHLDVYKRQERIG